MNRKEQAQASRAELLAAARSCFTEKGYESTTVAEILDRADMARGALYHYFPGGKADIFGAVFDLVDEEYHVRRDAMLVLPTAIDRLKGGVTVFLELCADESFARIALTDAPKIVPGQANRGTSYALLREQVAQAIANGEMRELDVDAVAIALYGAIRSAGEYIIDSGDRTAAIAVATLTAHALIDGLKHSS
jgi:AcrR family transcriptional regulator